MKTIGDTTFYDIEDVRKIYDELNHWDQSKFFNEICTPDAEEEIKKFNGWIDTDDALEYVKNNERLDEILWNFDDDEILEEVRDESILAYIRDNLTIDEIVDNLIEDMPVYIRDKKNGHRLPFTEDSVKKLKEFTKQIELLLA